jgi:Ca2+-transporting ATPase
LLLWVYVSGCIFIYGACLCAGQAEMRSLPEKTPVAQADKRDEP